MIWQMGRVRRLGPAQSVDEGHTQLGLRQAGLWLPDLDVLYPKNTRKSMQLPKGDDAACSFKPVWRHGQASPSSLRGTGKAASWQPLLAEEHGSQEVQDQELGQDGTSRPSCWRSLWWLLWFLIFIYLTSDLSTSRNNLDKFPITAQAHQDQDPLA